MNRYFIPYVIKEQRISLALFLTFSFLVLSIIPFYRYLYHETWPSGEIAYTHMRLGEWLLSGKFSALDTGVVVPTSYVFDPFDVLLGIVGKIIGFSAAALLLPFLLGYAAIIILYKIFQKFLPSPAQQLLAGIFVLTNPLFLTIFSEASNLAFISFVVTAGIYFFIKPNRQWLFCFVFFSFLIFYPIEHLLIVLLIIVFLQHISGEKKNGLFIVLFLLVAMFFSFLIKGVSVQWNAPLLQLFIQHIFSDLGGKFGFSIFGVALSLIGWFYFLQQKKNSRLFLIILFIIGFFVVFISTLYSIYLLPFMGIAATFGFFALLKREWKLPSLQNVTVFLLLLGILFSATSVISRNATAGPEYDDIDALLWLKENSYDNAIILTAEKYASVAAAITERRVLIDRNTVLNKQNAVVLEELHTLYSTRQIDVALSILEKYQVDYIIIFPDMKHGLVWERDDEGLLFVLENGENFKKVFENNKITIWSVYY